MVRTTTPIMPANLDALLAAQKQAAASIDRVSDAVEENFESPNNPVNVALARLSDKVKNAAVVIADAVNEVNLLIEDLFVVLDQASAVIGSAFARREAEPATLASAGPEESPAPSPEILPLPTILPLPLPTPDELPHDDDDAAELEPSVEGDGGDATASSPDELAVTLAANAPVGTEAGRDTRQAAKPVRKATTRKQSPRK